eukprot:scaffold24278_cov62-Phaeocystis_antarctica.AAC.1
MLTKDQPQTLKRQHGVQTEVHALSAWSTKVHARALVTSMDAIWLDLLWFHEARHGDLLGARKLQCLLQQDCDANHQPSRDHAADDDAGDRTTRQPVFRDDDSRLAHSQLRARLRRRRRHRRSDGANDELSLGGGAHGRRRLHRHAKGGRQRRSGVGRQLGGGGDSGGRRVGHRGHDVDAARRHGDGDLAQRRVAAEVGAHVGLEASLVEGFNRARGGDADLEHHRLHERRARFQTLAAVDHGERVAVLIAASGGGDQRIVFADVLPLGRAVVPGIEPQLADGVQGE